MKNVAGLERAMRIVESACENGEITIIGHGSLPTAEEMLAKCVDFINKKYGGDILNEVVGKALEKQKAEEADEEEEAKLQISDLDLDEVIAEVLGDWEYLNERAKEDIAVAVREFYDGLRGTPFSEYDLEIVKTQLKDALSEVCEYLTEDTLADMADSIVDAADWNTSWE